ncbi:helix-turn-helix domain-containing protein [Rhodovarius crocodyli]|nr:AraC family transcriptional regulator [Rhodovarius crocodyli]
MSRVEAFVAMHMDRLITVPEMAAAAGLGRCQFARLLKARLGCTPHGWLTRRRIAHARWLILNSDASLADIALACGLSDQSHLTRLFRRVMGQTPGRWRRAMRAAPPSA